MEQEKKQSDLLALLLRPELPNVMKELPEARYNVTRLSKLLGQKVAFTLRGLPYGKVERLRGSGSEDVEIDILLAGCVDPDLKAPQLRDRFGGPTPKEMVKAMLLPGEIADLSRAVERLCGYRILTIEEIKNV